MHDEFLHLENLAAELLILPVALICLDNWGPAPLLFKMLLHRVCPPAALEDLYPVCQQLCLQVHQSCPRQRLIKTVFEYSSKLLEHVNDELQHQVRLKAATFQPTNWVLEKHKEHT
jgi:hypothetical protein